MIHTFKRDLGGEFKLKAKVPVVNKDGVQIGSVIHIKGDLDKHITEWKVLLRLQRNYEKQYKDFNVNTNLTLEYEGLKVKQVRFTVNMIF